MEVLRGGFEEAKPEYTVTTQTADSDGPSVKKMAFSGLEHEFSEFVKRMKTYSIVNDFLVNTSQ